MSRDTEKTARSLYLSFFDIAIMLLMSDYETDNVTEASTHADTIFEAARIYAQNEHVLTHKATHSDNVQSNSSCPMNDQWQ